MKFFYEFNKKFLNYHSININQKRKFCTNQKNSNEYKIMTVFDPNIETLKFYKNYLESKKKKYDYQIEFENKLEHIQKIQKKLLNNRNKLSIIIGEQKRKFMGILENQSQVEEIQKIIREKISISEEKNLQHVSEYYFKEPGKMIRPYLLTSISKYIYECLYGEGSDYFNSVIHKKYVLPFAACVEVLHNASLLHDDIIDNSNQRRHQQTAHNIFGIRNTVFGANYIISRAANVITELEIEHLNEIYSSIVYYLTYGECQQSLKSNNLDKIDSCFQVYMIKTYYKTASLIAMGLRGIGVIYNFDDKMQRSLFNLGLHIGIVFQLIDDVMDVKYDSNTLKKPAFKDLTEGIINAYILFEIADEKNNSVKRDILEMAQRKFKNDGDLDKAKEIIANGNGVIKTENLALDHLLECYNILENPFFKNNDSKLQLYQCFDFLIKRSY